MLIKRREKKQDGNCIRMIRAILNKSWKQNLTKQQLYGHLPPISKTIQFRQDLRDTTREARKNSFVTFSYEPLPMVVPVLANQQELT